MREEAECQTDPEKGVGLEKEQKPTKKYIETGSGEKGERALRETGEEDPEEGYQKMPGNTSPFGDPRGVELYLQRRFLEMDFDSTDGTKQGSMSTLNSHITCFIWGSMKRQLLTKPSLIELLEWHWFS